jgi:hypothetical protein
MSAQDLKSAIHTKLVQSGEKEKLKEHLRMRLIESGWRDQVYYHSHLFGSSFQMLLFVVHLIKSRETYSTINFVNQLLGAWGHDSPLWGGTDSICLRNNFSWPKLNYVRLGKDLMTQRPWGIPFASTLNPKMSEDKVLIVLAPLANQVVLSYFLVRAETNPEKIPVSFVWTARCWES